MNLTTLAILIPLAPLLGAALIGAIGLRNLKDRSHWLALAGVGIALLCAIGLFTQVQSWGHGEHPDAASVTRSVVLYEWFGTGDRNEAGAPGWFNVEFQIDPLTSIMLLTVLGVSFLVVVYSVGYMRDHHGHPERGYERFFAFLALFVFSMCMLVLGGNFLLLYLGWELVGLCSYLLIGFYYPKPEAAAAAKKAFLVNRIGDFGFGLGILLIYWKCGDLSYTYVFSEAGMNALQGYETLAALLLFCGAVGKSAQLPLHVWLPDAMEGPTPVSALIHAATMVTAGVYMVARCHVLFEASPIAMWIVGSIGAVTALFAATIALTQFDMKRILAYSTVSQLGYMFLGLGVGAFSASIFHLFTHAFFKALLFLGAGSVMHAMHGTIDIRRFGGLKTGLRTTYITFLIGGLALAGFPLFSGFWSKDQIIHAAVGSDMPWLGWIGVLTALLTAFYTFRMIFIAFHGPLKLPRGVEHAHENGRWITVPLILLAIGAIGAGFFGASHDGGIHGFLSPVLMSSHEVAAAASATGHHEEGALGFMILSGVISIIGILAARYIYLRRPLLAMAAAYASGSVYRLFLNKYYVDELYEMIVVSPLRWLGRICYGIDRYVIDSLLWLIALFPRAVGFGLRGFQQGAMQGYALGMVVGVAVIVLWVLAAA